MNKEINNHPLLTADQIGKEIGVTGRTILNLEARGIIQARIRVGKIVRFNLDEVRAQLAAATEQNRRDRKAGHVRDAQEDHVI